MEPKWYHASYRRHLLSKNYEDWDDSFLSCFEPEEHVRLLKLANVKSTVVFTNSHVGLCYWPSSRAPMHRGNRGRDMVGETVAACRREGIDPILYMSFIYDNWAYAQHPEWRITDANGKTSREWAEGYRYGLCCPNSPYREFALAQLSEICGRYDVPAVHPDMLFWNGICLCKNCRERFARETGMEPPEAVDWNDPVWVAYNRKRAEWMTGFADDVCAAARRARPGITVSIQSSGVFSSWGRGVDETEIRGSDYSYGDLYGGLPEESFACKFFHNYTPDMPFQYETIFCDVNWTEHAIRKPVEMMELQTVTTIAHGGAFLFIEPIGPAGRILNPRVYAEMGRIFSSVEKVEPWLGGRLCEDVGVYYSQRSGYSPEENGMALTAPARGMPHLSAVIGAASVLSEAHIPCGVTNKLKLSELGRYQALVLPDVMTMDDEEAEAFRQYVADGGNLYASGRTFHPKLADVLGMRPDGETREAITYVNAIPGRDFLPETFSGYPLTIRGRQVEAEPVNLNEVMAVINLPPLDPADRTRFVSVHSDPPFMDTDFPAVISRKYQKGNVIWASAAFEASKYLPHREVFLGLMRKLIAKPLVFECDAPGQVELVLTHNAEKKHYLASLLNLQEKMPPLPVFGFTVRVNLKGENAKSVVRLPEGKPAEFTVRDGFAEFKVDRLDLWAMFAIRY